MFEIRVAPALNETLQGRAEPGSLRRQVRLIEVGDPLWVCGPIRAIERTLRRGQSLGTRCFVPAGGMSMGLQGGRLSDEGGNAHLPSRPARCSCQVDCRDAFTDVGGLVAQRGQDLRP